ncbi:hypothetical protein ACFQYP_27255 [Nonomuraea antimicrobica]
MGFGVREFELALMHRMRDLNPARVEQALHAMDASRAELRDAHTRWTRLAHAPERRRAPPRCGWRWAPPLSGQQTGGQPDLRRPALAAALVAGPGVRGAARPRRRAVEPVVRPPLRPRRARADRPHPWTCVVGDLGASFPGAVQIDGPAPHHWTVDFRHGGRAYRARFVHGLLQRLDPAPPSSMGRSEAAD